MGQKTLNRLDIVRNRLAADDYSKTAKPYATKILRDSADAEQAAKENGIILADALNRGDASFGARALKATEKAEMDLVHAEGRANIINTLQEAEDDKRLRVVIRKLSDKRDGRIGGARVFNAIKAEMEYARKQDSELFQSDTEKYSDLPAEEWTVHPNRIVDRVIHRLS